MSNKEVVQEDSEYDYDSLNDTFYIYYSSRKYSSSMILDDLVIYLNSDHKVIGIEVLNASKKFGISKYELRAPVGLGYKINVSDSKVNINLKFTFLKRNHHVARTMSVTGVNDMNLVPSSSAFALA